MVDPSKHISKNYSHISWVFSQVFTDITFFCEAVSESQILVQGLESLRLTEKEYLSHQLPGS